MTTPRTEQRPVEEVRAAMDEEIKRGGVIVCLGNRAGIELVADPNDSEETAAAEGRAIRKVPNHLGDGKRCTTVVIPADNGIAAGFVDITSPTGIWSAHSADPAPAWVASTNPVMASLLAQHYGCEQREYEPDHEPSAPAAADTDTTER
jgi:hypothetical protein